MLGEHLSQDGLIPHKTPERGHCRHSAQRHRASQNTDLVAQKVRHDGGNRHWAPHGELCLSDIYKRAPPPLLLDGIPSVGMRSLEAAPAPTLSYSARSRVSMMSKFPTDCRKTQPRKLWSGATDTKAIGRLASSESGPHTQTLVFLSTNTNPYLSFELACQGDKASNVGWPTGA